MPSKYVPWIVLQVSTSTRTYRGSLRPPKWRPKAKNGQKITILFYTGQFGSSDPVLLSRSLAFIGELITLKDTPPISSRLGCRWIPPAKKNTSWPISPLYSIHIQKKFLAKTKRLKLISNHSMVVSGLYYNPFQGSQGPQEGSEAKILTFWPKNSKWPFSPVFIF